MADNILYKGRNRIFTAAEEVTEENLMDVLLPALCQHNINVTAENYLYLYRAGDQPILRREKEIRDDINNKCVQNMASEIVAFKNGYLLPHPVNYIARNEEKAELVKKLNDYLYVSGKHDADNELVDWFHTVGVAPLYVESTEGEVPCRAYAIDPRRAFVVYSLQPGNEPVFGVNVVEVTRKGVCLSLIDVYTKDRIYRLEGQALDQYTESNMKLVPPTIPTTTVVRVDVNEIGEIPIIEYVYDNQRMGSFETVLPLLDAQNIVQSNRLDGIEQFIQSLMVLINCKLPDGETSNSVRSKGMVELVSDNMNPARIEILTEQLDQSQTQTLVDDIRHQICEIAGMPFTSTTYGGTSDNVGAVYLRNGWQTADTFARNTEDLYKKSNRQFNKIFLKILQKKDLIGDLSVYDFDSQFTRNEMDNLQSKVQAALGLKQLGLAPEIVLARSGVSNDPSGDVARSTKYIDIAYAEPQPEIQTEGKAVVDDGGSTSGQRSD